MRRKTGVWKGQLVDRTQANAKECEGERACEGPACTQDATHVQNSWRRWDRARAPRRPTRKARTKRTCSKSPITSCNSSGPSTPWVTTILGHPQISLIKQNKTLAVQLFGTFKPGCEIGVRTGRSDHNGRVGLNMFNSTLV